MTGRLEEQPAIVLPAEPLEQLALAPHRARQLLGRRSPTRRAELAEALEALADAVATALETLPENSLPIGSKIDSVSAEEGNQVAVPTTRRTVHQD
jgi:hypothetical protein